MNTTEKKFLFPRLYPVSGDMNKKWFIKYQTEDFTTGKFKSEKYYGALNLVKDEAERKAIAQQYLKMFARGEMPPAYQGMKRVLPDTQKQNFANATQCCRKYLQQRKFELHQRSVTQYTGYINLLQTWLQKNNMAHLAIGAITKETVREFLNHLLSEKKFSAKTYNGYKTFFGTVWQEYVKDEKIKRNPWRDVPGMPEQPQHFESWPRELRLLVRQQMPQYDFQTWVFILGIYNGIRPCELRMMRVKDFLPYKKLFIVPTEIAKGPKGKKRSRAVNIYSQLYEILLQLDYNNYPPNYFLFSKDATPGEQPVPVNWFRNKWNAFKLLHNIPAQYKLYGCKHTAGKSIAKQFGSYVAQQHFGHSSEESTRQYIDNLDKNELAFLQTQMEEF